MKIAQRVTQITPSATMAVKRAADELKRQGVSVIDLGPGEPDFPTPEHIKRAAEEALAQNFTKYTAETGIWELRDAIAQKYNRDYGTHYTADNVLVTSGAKQALYNIAAALFEPGDEVLIPIPYWVSFPEQIKLVGAKPVFIHTAKNFQLSAELVKEHITPRTRAIILNSPNNPAGTVLSRKDLQEIIELAQRHKLFVIYDECYEKFLYEGEHVSAVELDTEGVIAVSSASKTYAMTGWRVGWSVAPQGAHARDGDHSKPHDVASNVYLAESCLGGYNGGSVMCRTHACGVPQAARVRVGRASRYGWARVCGASGGVFYLPGRLALLQRKDSKFCGAGALSARRSARSSRSWRGLRGRRPCENFLCDLA
jgi:aspartate/methionine/tyrosine aminotransferase